MDEPAAERSDDTRWQWTPRDQQFHFEIPRSERVQGSLSDQGQAGQENFNERSNSDLLKGRSPEEVNAEAKRIQLGGVFVSLEEFDRCLNSYSVLIGRAVHRWKTRPDLCVRVCRFGPNVRVHERGTNGDTPSGICSDDCGGVG